MTVYLYKILKSAQGVSVHIAEHSNRQSLRKGLVKERQVVLSVKRLVRPWRSQDKVEFWKSVDALVSARMKIHECLSLLSDSLSRRPLRLMAKAMVELMQSGQNFSACCERFSSFFNAFEIRLLEIAEVSGQLPTIVHSLCLTAQAQEKSRRQVVSACVYPLILLIIVFCGAAFLNILLSSSALMVAEGKQALSHDHIVTWFVFCGGAAFLFFFLRRSSQVKQVWQLGLQSRFVGERLFIISLRHWLYGMSLLLAHHICLLDSVKACTPFLGKRSAVILGQVSGGALLSQALVVAFPHFPSLFLGQVRVAEQTGGLAEAFRFMSEYAESQTQAGYERLGQCIQPMGILLVGLLIISLVIDFIAPLYDLLQEIK